ncbi:MAG: ABC transporter substrate-binding protein [Deltaproteobacteria bacterium]|nr:ABC transporter substrate-binding protein [Deltaproteobacteria bacterium]
MIRSSRTKRMGMLAVAAVAGALLLTPAGWAAEPGKLTPISIGVGPNLSSLDVWLAQKKGYFRAAGLEVNVVILTAGSQAVPQLLGGQLHFAAVDTAVTVTGRAKSVPIIMTAQNIVGAPNPERGYANLLVPANSPVHKLSELAGRAIAVNQINGSAWALTRATLDNAGVDSSKVKFIEVPPPQLLAALEQGRADAAVIAEPNASLGVSQGMRVLANVEATSVPGVPVFTFISSEAWARANPEIVRRFNEIMLRANAEINGNRAEAIEIAKTATKIPHDVLPKAFFPIFGTTPFDPAQLQKFVDLTVKYGLVPADKAPAPSTLYYSGR